MKKYAYLKWANNIYDVKYKYNWIKKMPLFLRDKYILKNCPLNIEEVSILGVDGFKVVLPILLQDIEKKSRKYVQEIIDKTMEILEENSVRIIIPPKEKSNIYSYSIPIAKGEIIFPLFIYQVILKSLKIINKPLKTVEIAILDGKNKNTDLILDIVYPHVNYLSIISDDVERFKIKAKKIYEDVGLNLQLLSYNNRTALKNTNVIIDCMDNTHTYFYYAMREVIYFYMGTNKEVVKNILLKRPDIKVIDDIILSIKNKKITTDLCEMLWFISKPWFNRLLSKKYTQEDIKKITKEIKKDGWEVKSLCQYGNIIH
ncbi:hypothetical protein [Defluviitalea phaphyphila]|uniref:hypothetical protein n=1 Tax=Defluviitalea phaphyphila TaxID=1473580 RepID=UPI0007314BA2|nr:hypothetical protein [Defluviitalea phaphyphila]